MRLGGYEPIKTDIKVISAVNERPMDCVKAGKLREDLFYRLSVVQVNIPPLRERRDDILYMASRFIEAYNQSMHRDIMGLDEQVEELFRSYAWPGNVRELKNIIEGAFNVASTRFIQKKDLRDDNGELFGFGTHMFRHVYGIRLTEMHLDDWTIAKLLGHTSVKNVKFYRKMSLQIIADETREIRAEMSRMIRANLAGWGKEYEQI